MATMRLMPPSTGATSITVNNRLYSCAVGSTIDVPGFDAYIMLANGWLASAAHSTGTTANRPVNPKKGTQFLDTTLGALIVFDGKTWRNHQTGAAV